MSSPGSRPLVGPNGEIIAFPEIPSVMKDPGQKPTLREDFVLGAAKAHRQIVSCEYDHRNAGRSYLGTTGKVG